MLRSVLPAAVLLAALLAALAVAPAAEAPRAPQEFLVHAVGDPWRFSVNPTDPGSSRPECERGPTGPILPVAGVPVTVLAGCHFDPPMLEIHVGDAVSWDVVVMPALRTAHVIDNSHPLEGPARFGSAALFEGDTFSFTFTVPGDYTYRCALHDNPTAIPGGNISPFDIGMTRGAIRVLP